jgi:hypothetical protein
MADMCLAWCQHFAFHEYKDQRGNRLFAGHSNRYLFNQPKYKLVNLRFQCQLCSTSTAHISRKGSDSDLTCLQ